MGYLCLYGDRDRHRLVAQSRHRESHIREKKVYSRRMFTRINIEKQPRNHTR